MTTSLQPDPPAPASQAGPNSPFVQAPCLVVLVLALAGALALLALSFVDPDLVGGSWFRFGGASLADYQVNDNLTRITGSDGSVWTVTYESLTTSTFTGLIRHTENYRDAKFPMLTHDILVTSGDFADRDKVRTSVANHRFVWVSLKDSRPVGKINLLHIIPRTDEVYEQLRALSDGQSASITGWEILRIDALDEDGNPVQWWADAGCNTILVESVTLLKVGD